MREFQPPAVYVTRRAAEDERCRARMERLLTKITGPPPEEIDDARLADLIRGNQWGASRVRAADDNESDPPIVFNRFRWEAMDEEGRPTVELPGPGPAIFYGFAPWKLRRHEHILESHDVCSQTACELHSLRGCPFRCQHCPLENVLNIMLDVEEFADHVMSRVAGAPQTLYKYDAHGDVVALEPEYGSAAHLTELFGRQDRAYLMHYTKAGDVDSLLGLEHNGRTIICWTISSHTVTRVVERHTATMEERIEAARRCQQAGYPVRFRFSPVFPLHDWRDEYRQCVELLFSRVKPDVVSLLTLSHLPDYDMIAHLFDRRLLDPEYVEAAEAARDQGQGRPPSPLPDWVREEIYDFMTDEIHRVSPDTPVAICLETPQAGAALGEEPEDYACCTGPRSTPNGPGPGGAGRGTPASECENRNHE